MKKNQHKPHEQYINTLMNVSRAITSDKCMEDIVKLIVMVAANTIDADACFLWLTEENVTQHKLRLKATHVTDDCPANDYLLGDMDQLITECYEYCTGSFIIKDALKNPWFREKKWVKRIGPISMIGVPLTVNEDQRIGVMTCFRKKTYSFTEAEKNLLETVANQAAITITNTEMFVRNRVVHEEMKTIRIIEKARNILMKKNNLGIMDAQNWLRKCSIESLATVRQVAEAVLISYDYSDYETT